MKTLNGIQEVSGSIPLISTKRKALKLNGFGAFKFFSYTDAPCFGLYSVFATFKMSYPFPKIQSRSFLTCSVDFYLSDAVMKALELKEYS